MNIFTFIATDTAAPTRAVARIWLGKKDGWHPVIFSADTPEEADTKATGWWEAESAKADKRRRPRKGKTAAPGPKELVADPGDVI